MRKASFDVPELSLLIGIDNTVYRVALSQKAAVTLAIMSSPDNGNMRPLPGALRWDSGLSGSIDGLPEDAYDVVEAALVRRLERYGLGADLLPLRT